jgi:hypothetical protein
MGINEAPGACAPAHLQWCTCVGNKQVSLDQSVLRRLAVAAVVFLPDAGGTVRASVYVFTTQPIISLSFSHLFHRSLLLLRRSYRIVKIFHVRPEQGLVNPKYWDQMVVRESYLFRLYGVVLVALYAVRAILYALDINFTLVEGYGCSREFDALWLGLHVVEIAMAGVAIYKLRRYLQTALLAFGQSTTVEVR